MKGIDAIFFDLDDTLYPAEEAYAFGLRAAHRALARHQKLTWKAFMTRYRDARNLVKSTLGEVPAARNRLLYLKALLEGLDRPKSHLTLEIMRAYDTCWDKVDTQEASQLVKRLSSRYTLGLITNQVAAMQLHKIQRIDPRGEYFKVIMTSEEAGVEKPDAKIFRLTCQRAGVRPSRSLMVGDSWKADVMGAKRAGIRPIFLSPKKPPRLKSVERIKKLSELEVML